MAQAMPAAGEPPPRTTRALGWAAIAAVLLIASLTLVGWLLDIPLLKSDPKKVRGQHYDVVVNGVELGGGSIRIHQPDVQKTVFEEVLQIPPEETKLRFGYMLEAFRYGAPPHGGIALGFDRLCAILCGTPSIRDVIAFPKTAKGTDLMTDSPAAVSPRQLRDLHIEVKAAKKESP